MKKIMISVFVICVLAVMLSVTLFACAANAPKNVDEAKAKMRNAGYEINNAEDYMYFAMVGVDVSKMKGAIEAAKGSISVDAVLFEDQSSAKEFRSKMISLIKLEDSNLSTEEIEKEVELYGKWVLIGDEQAREDFKK